MDDLGGGPLEAAPRRDEELERRAPGPRFGAQPGAEGQPLDELHHQEDPPVVLAELVDLDDVRVRQASHRPGLGEERGAALDGVGLAAVEHLEGDAAAELLVVGRVDRAHAAAAEHPEDDEAIDPHAAARRRAAGRCVRDHRRRELRRRRRVAEPRVAHLRRVRIRRPGRVEGRADGRREGPVADPRLVEGGLRRRLAAC
ncbi:MAG: hypothetical protein R3A79_13555 [Nannocystaceae bacterium]